MVARVCEVAPEKYFREVAAYYGCDTNVFLLNPTWTGEQRATAESLIERFAARSRETCGKIFIASGGSGGKIRFVAHTRETLENSACALIEHLSVPAGTPLNCFSCLPPWHISGMMTFVRSRVSGGKLHIAKKNGFHGEDSLEDFRQTPEEFWTISLVPTQLTRVLALRNGAAWLRKFDFILLGGAALPSDLVARAKAEKLNFGIGYGMTETASLVSLWRCGDSQKIAGTTLPHAKIFISETDSRIRIAARSLGETLGDDGSPVPNAGGIFETNDEGRFDEAGRLQVLGRADRYINSGGEKIDPKLLEVALREAGAADAMVVGEPDVEWGQRVVALVVPPFPQDILSRLREKLPAWMLPKRLISVPALPLDAKGKLNRIALAQALARTE